MSLGTSWEGGGCTKCTLYPLSIHSIVIKLICIECIENSFLIIHDDYVTMASQISIVRHLRLHTFQIYKEKYISISNSKYIDNCDIEIIVDDCMID